MPSYQKIKPPPHWRYVGEFLYLSDIFGIIEAASGNRLRNYRIEERKRRGELYFHFYIFF